MVKHVPHELKSVVDSTKAIMIKDPADKKKLLRPVVGHLVFSLVTGVDSPREQISYST